MNEEHQIKIEKFRMLVKQAFRKAIALYNNSDKSLESCRKILEEVCSQKPFHYRTALFLGMNWMASFEIEYPISGRVFGPFGILSGQEEPFEMYGTKACYQDFPSWLENIAKNLHAGLHDEEMVQNAEKLRRMMVTDSYPEFGLVANIIELQHDFSSYYVTTIMANRAGYLKRFMVTEDWEECERKYHELIDDFLEDLRGEHDEI